MTSDFADRILLDFLEGDRDVVLAAALLCDAVMRSRLCRAASAAARELLAFTLVEAGVTLDDLPEISSAFMFVHHRSCEIGCVPHFSIEGLSDEC